VALYYADASALVKLVRTESHTAALRAYLDGADIVSSEIVLAEVPRAIRRAVHTNPALALDALLANAGDLLDAVALVPVDREIVVTAGMLPEPALRALDAIHIASAIAVRPADAFVTYDVRQAAAARLVGLRTTMP
jgi:uncharacterized protein